MKNALYVRNEELNLSLTDPSDGMTSPTAADMAVGSVAAGVSDRKLQQFSPTRARMSQLGSLRIKTWSIPSLRLALLSLLAVAVHGYHLGADDAGIYLPAVFQVIHPDLYPYGAEFFRAHARRSQFALVVGTSARMTALNDDLIIFLWHIATILLFLLAAWQLAAIFFHSERARWSAVLLSAAVLTVPVAGTALVIMDPYLTSRSASTPLTMFAVAAWLANQRARAISWIVLAFLVHPLMAAYGLLCLAILAIPETWTNRLFRLGSSDVSSSAAAVIPAAFSFGPVDPGYRQALFTRTFLFLSEWAWWEWIGVVAPLAILVTLGSWTLRGTTPEFRRMSRALVLLGLLATLFGLIFSLPAMDGFVWLQPMRAFHLIYIVFFLLFGGLLGEFLLKSRYWLWIGVLASLACGMFSIQSLVYPDSRHVEWPGASPTNPWVSAFEWVRGNTPQNAVFALDPNYIILPGEDGHGFRAIAQRSVLSDYYKDSGVVSLFPELAPEWQREQLAQQGWSHFSLADFQRLATQYPVSWVVLQGAAPAGLDCPYRNRAVTVCRIPGSVGLK